MGWTIQRRVLPLMRSPLVVAALAVGAILIAALGVLGYHELISGSNSSQVYGAKVGVYRSGEGQLAVAVDLCPGEHVTSVVLMGKSQPPLWRITAVTPSDNSQFVVGSAPEGFRQDVAPRPDASTSSSLFFAVRTDGPAGSFGIEFSSSNAKEDTIWIHGPGPLGSKTHVDRARFTSIRDELC